MAERVLVTGAGGFIGHRMVKYLVARGYWVRGADLNPPEFEPSPAHEFDLVDLRHADVCLRVAQGMNQVYHLAAELGGSGWNTPERALIARNNTVLNIAILEAARLNGVRRFLFSSSASVYPRYRHRQAALQPSREDDAWPADPEEGYGLENLYMEKLCQYYSEDCGLETRVARFHNVYGPLGKYEGGREKAPAAICRKVALAARGGVIDVWGDGKQMRSFTYVDDCIEGMHRLMVSDCPIPVNLDSGQTVTVDELVTLVAEIAQKAIRIRHIRWMPEGPRRCDSDGALSRHVLKWEPQVSLAEGLRRTYAWISLQLAQRGHSEESHPGARASASGRLPEAIGTVA